MIRRYNNANELFNELMGDFFDNPFNETEWKFTNNKKTPLRKEKISENLPSTNVVETKGDYQYELATPGFDKGEVKIKLENNVLTIKGEKIIGDKKSDRDYLSKEFHFHRFSRSFDVPDNVVLDEIYARVENGITTLFLPKEKLGKKESVKRNIDIV
jgi:HSP20 family protein